MASTSKQSDWNGSNRPACAACRHQRRKCKEDCVLAPYYPTSRTREYLEVYRVFGYSNLTKMLHSIPEHSRKQALLSFEWEALVWKQDPILGPLGLYRKLQQECEFLKNQLKLHHLQQKVSRRSSSSGESKFIGITQEDLALPAVPLNIWAPGPVVPNNNNNNGAGAVVVGDNIGQKFGYSENSSSAYGFSVLHPAEALYQRNSMMEHNYFPTQENQIQRIFTLPHTDPSSAMDPPRQIRGFPHYNEYKGQGQEQGIGTIIQRRRDDVDNSLMVPDTDHHAQRHSRIKLEGHHY